MQSVIPKGTAFRFFYGSFVASILGDAFRLLAVNVWIFEATEGSTTDRLVLILLGNVPGMLLGGVAGVLADRWDRFRILLTSDLLRFVVGLGLAACAVTSSPYAALGLIAVGNALGVFFATSAFAMVPSLVEEDELPKVNGLMETSQWAVQIVGPSLAALTLAFRGAPVAFVVDGLSFIVSAALLWMVRREFLKPAVAEEHDDADSVNDDAEPLSGVDSFLAGLKFIRGNPQVLALLLASYGVTFIAACTNFTLIFLVADTLGQNAAVLGALFSLNGAVAVGAAALTTMLLSTAQLARTLTIAMVGLCAAQVIMGLSPNLWVLGLGVVVSALANAPYNVAVTTLYMKRIPNEYLGRVEGVDTMVDNAVSIAAFLVSLFVVSVADPRWAFIISAAVALPSLILAAVRVRDEEDDKTSPQPADANA